MGLYFFTWLLTSFFVVFKKIFYVLTGIIVTLRKNMEVEKCGLKYYAVERELVKKHGTPTISTLSNGFHVCVCA